MQRSGVPQGNGPLIQTIQLRGLERGRIRIQGSSCGQSHYVTETSRKQKIQDKQQDPRSYMKKGIIDLLRLPIDRVNWIVSSCVKLQLHKVLVMHSICPMLQGA
jgi:hypothetical protein